MYFNSYIFVLAFLPVTLIGYYLINRTKQYRLGEAWLLAASLFFIGYSNIMYVWITLISIGMGYIFLKGVSYRSYSHLLKKIILIIGIVFHIGLLFYFKYSNFFLENLNYIFKCDFVLREIILPIGISFYTFQQIAYLVDCYKAPDIKCSLLEYAVFVTFYPKFLQGPILLHEDMLPQLRNEKNKQFSFEQFSKGLYMFALGLGKKVLLADNIACIVNVGYGNITKLNAPSAFLTMLAYSLQLYFDFSGYSDMAIGLGEMFGIKLPLNFNSPYKAVTVTDIWSRWHMTLTRFFTRYIYIPLGGNRKGAIRMYLNTVVVFLVSGLWHGAAWTFILWGCLHAAAYVCSKFLQRKKFSFPRIIGWTGTFLFWVFSFAIFRASSLEEAKQLFSQLLYGGMGRLNQKFFNAIEYQMEIRILQRLDVAGVLEVFPELIVILLVLLPLIGCVCMKNSQQKLEQFRFTYSKLWVTVMLLFFSILSFGGMNIFLYVNF